jgi:hypothetical protein
MKLIYLSALFVAVITSCKSQPAKEDFKQIAGIKIPGADSLLNKKKWDVNDYAKGFLIFKNVKDIDSNLLSNYSKTEGSALFKRMTFYPAYDSLLMDVANEKQLGLSNRMTNIMNQFSKLFYSFKKENGKLQLGQEMISCFIANLALWKINLGLINKLFPDKDSLDEVRKNGYEKVQFGVFEMIAGSLITIGHDYLLYQEKDIIRLAEYSKPFITIAWPFLTEAYRNKITDEIEMVKRSDTYKAAKNIFLY